jgi:Xaa-Pro dipeptidase
MNKPISKDFLSRREFVQASALAGAAAFAPLPLAAQVENAPALPAAFSALQPLGGRVQPIGTPEFRARFEHAIQLMQQPTQTAGQPSRSSAKLDAIFIAPGTSLYYFTGVDWWPSERLLALIMPREREPFMVCPAFEEGRLREQLRWPIEIRTWQEDQSPAQRVAEGLADRGLRSGGMIGVEETAKFTFFDHVRHAAPAFEYVSADAVIAGCRARKSAQELALMRLACEATFSVFRAAFASLREGMSQAEISDLVSAGFAKIKLHGNADVFIGASAALPHGSREPRTVREGDVVLIDGGCAVERYRSDVTRTGVFGKPSAKAARAFEIVRKAQDAALEAARAGGLSGGVDDAARKVIVDAGYGPGYKYFTHRLGHGIGLDGHEHPYLVRGSLTVLEAGMTFSNEPGIYIPGEFGLRCEDDMVISPEGPAQLLTPGFPVSLEKPFG